LAAFVCDRVRVASVNLPKETEPELPLETPEPTVELPSVLWGEQAAQSSKPAWTVQTEACSKPAIYDCLVLSGGGAKGAYGAGVAKAIAAYREKKKSTNSLCYIGASAGALNAYLLSAKGPDELIHFWLSATNRSVLGVHIRNATVQGLFRWAAGLLKPHQPFSIYSNRSLRQLIEANSRLEDLKHPLIVAATDYTQGKLKSFYASDLIDDFVREDRKQKIARQRLRHFRRIETNDQLVDALLASAAIPLFFPPVAISAEFEGSTETSWYVDGGIGNNTPTREAAYFLRYLEESGSGRSGLVFCVRQDAPRALQEQSQRVEFSDILMRTLDVYHRVHTDAIIGAWSRINDEVEQQRDRVASFTAWLDQQSFDKSVSAAIEQQISKQFLSLGGVAKRLEVPLVEIEPTSELGDTLDFNPIDARDHILRGYNDALKVLLESHKIEDQMRLDEAEYEELVNQPIFGR
jgi:predicted acylesterase/phospholipase RssA